MLWNTHWPSWIFMWNMFYSVYITDFFFVFLLQWEGPQVRQHIDMQSSQLWYTWKHFMYYWLHVRGIHQWLGHFPHQGSVMQHSIVSFLLAQTNCWTNGWFPNDSRACNAHVMLSFLQITHNRHAIAHTYVVYFVRCKCELYFVFFVLFWAMWHWTLTKEDLTWSEIILSNRVRYMYIRTKCKMLLL